MDGDLGQAHIRDQGRLNHNQFIEAWSWDYATLILNRSNEDIPKSTHHLRRSAGLMVQIPKSLEQKKFKVLESLSIGIIGWETKVGYQRFASF